MRRRHGGDGGMKDDEWKEKKENERRVGHVSNGQTYTEENE